MHQELKCTVQLVLCTVFTVAVRMKYIYMCGARKHKLCHFGDSAYDLNVLLFAFKISIAPQKYKQQIYANNLIFIFLLRTTLNSK